MRRVNDSFCLVLIIFFVKGEWRIVPTLLSTQIPIETVVTLLQRGVVEREHECRVHISHISIALHHATDAQPVR